jgi:glycosyltransferase involved in cell wall biosynthesis
MSKKRILEFASYAGIGGTQTMLLEFLRRASHDKYEFYVCVLLEPGFLNDEVSKLGIEHTSLNMKGYWDLTAWWKLYQFAKGKQIDLIRTYGLKAHIIGRIVGRILGIPVNITSVRNTDPWRKWYHAFLDFLTSRLTDLYISNSEAGRIATHRREHIPLSKIITIPNGIDLTNCVPRISQMPGTSGSDMYRQEFGIPPTTHIIGIVANLRKQKGHKTIVDALPLIQEKIPDIVCLFVGEDLLDGEIQRYVRARHLERTVIFTGFRQDIPELLSIFDVFLLPSLWEGIPRAVLEAMALKKPVVVTAVGGIPEIVEPDRTGIFVPPENPKALAAAVVFLLNNPDIAVKMGQAGYEKVQRCFSLESVVAKTEEVYDRLIKSNCKDFT